MIVRSVRHRGLRKLLEDDDARFLPDELVDRIRRILTVIILAEDWTTSSPTLRPAGAFADSRETEGSNGASRYPAIGGSPLKRTTATYTD